MKTQQQEMKIQLLVLLLDTELVQEQKYNVGYDAATLITSGSNNICIGVDAGVTGSPGGAISTGSNVIVLGDNNIND